MVYLWAIGLILTTAFAEPQHGFSTFGQLKYPKGFQRFDYTLAHPYEGGELKLAAQGTFDSLNPFIVTGTPADYIGLTFSTLLDQAKDEPATSYAYVAETIEVAPDHSWVIFTLHPQAQFNNGEKITVEDVIFSFEILRTKGLPLYREYYKNVEKAEKISDTQIKFSFNTKNNRELPLILGQLPILSKKYFETHSFSESTLTAFPSSGPYEIVHVDPGRSITYKRVQNWWAKDNASQKNQFNFDTIRVDYYRDPQAMFEAFKTGDVDLRLENSAKQWATGYDFTAVKNNQIKLLELPVHISSGTYGLFFNTRKDIFKSPQVRKALSFLLDFNWLNKNIFYNLYTRNLSYFPNSELACKEKLEESDVSFLKELVPSLPKVIFEGPFTLPIIENETQLRDVLQQSKNILLSEGWVIQNQKLVKDNKPFTFEILIYDKAHERFLLNFIATLKRVGIEAKIRLMDVSTYQERVDQLDFDMILGGIPQSPTPGNEQRNFFGSLSVHRKGTMNYAGIQSPVLDTVIEKLIESPDYETLKTRVRVLDRLLLEGYYMIPAWNSPTLKIAVWDKFMIPEPAKYSRLDFLTWSFDPSKIQTPKPVKKSLWQQVKEWFMSLFTQVD